MLGPDLVVQLSVTGGTSTGQLSAVRFFAFDSSYRATCIGTAAGSAVRVRAAVSGVPLTTVPSLVVHAPLPNFTFCSSTGAVCEFIGRRDVRLVAADGQTFTQTVYGSVPCAASGYERGFTGAPSSEGSFRMTRTLTNMAFIDPIVYPGVLNSSHLHMFFGNAGTPPTSTAATVSASGNGSCAGGTVNRTGYWVPAQHHRDRGRHHRGSAVHRLFRGPRHERRGMGERFDRGACTDRRDFGIGAGVPR